MDSTARTTTSKMQRTGERYESQYARRPADTRLLTGFSQSAFPTTKSILPTKDEEAERKAARRKSLGMYRSMHRAIAVVLLTFHKPTDAYLSRQRPPYTPGMSWNTCAITRPPQTLRIAHAELPTSRAMQLSPRPARRWQVQMTKTKSPLLRRLSKPMRLKAHPLNRPTNETCTRKSGGEALGYRR